MKLLKGFTITRRCFMRLGNLAFRIVRRQLLQESLR